MSTETKFVDGNLVVSRIYAAAQEDVFDAWVATSKVQKWWGCADCTSVRSEIELKVGGRYNHHMTIKGVPDEIPGFATLTEYDPPNRLAYTSDAPDGSGNPMTVTVEFSQVEGGTCVKLVHAGIPDMRVEGDMEIREIVRAGWTAAFGKLGDFLSVPSQA